MTIKEIEEKTGKEVICRSCFKCNSAHKHLKKEKDYIILCFECGGLYLEGKELNIEELEKEGKK